jgi:hypothetical protein
LFPDGVRPIACTGAGQEDPVKKVVWTALVAVTSALAATLAIRALRAVWIEVTHEEPPERPWWAKKVVGGPLSSSARRFAAE